MANLQTIPKLLSHGVWRIQHDARDVPHAAYRLARFTAGAVRKELDRRWTARMDRYVVHSAIHTTGNNLGDMVLPLAIRKVIDCEVGPQDWYLQPLWRSIGQEQAATFNAKASLLIVGGGGLLLKDNKPSGWQWNIDIDTLRSLTVPMCLFAVGYNRFRGDDEFGSVFRDHVQLTAEKSLFVGLRNQGSLNELASHLPSSLHGKLRVQPCVTTVLSRFYPTYKASLKRSHVKELAVNACFDRAEKRFSGSVEVEIRKLLDILRWAHQDGWKIHLTYHAFEDAAIAPHLVANGIPFERHWLPREDPERAIDLYTRIPLVLGMRGHAQMIPYGVGSMIIPLITHNKLVYMLEEFGMSDWGVEFSSPNFVADVVERIKRFDNARDATFAHLERSKDRLWQLTKTNVRDLLPYLKRPVG